MKKKPGRKPIPDEDRKVTAGIWVKKKHKEKLRPILKALVETYEDKLINT